MKAYTLFLVLLIGGLFVGGCNVQTVKPSNKITTEVRPVSGFNHIDIDDALTVDIVHTPGTEQVIVEANSNVHPYIVTNVVSGTLFIHRTDKVKIKSGATIRIFVTASELEGIDVAGASTGRITNELNADNLFLSVSGASKCEGTVQLNTADVNVSGASHAALNGIAGNVTSEVSGASALTGFGFKMDNLNIKLSGASSASLRVDNLIDVRASGASTLDYTGSATIESVQLSGGSSVNKH